MCPTASSTIPTHWKNVKGIARDPNSLYDRSTSFCSAIGSRLTRNGVPWNLAMSVIQEIK